MSEQLSADLNIIQSAPIELELLDGDLNIIQKLDDEPNDVGGLTSAELKAKFDESGNIIKKYINETLIPAVLAEDATEESRKQAEAARVAAEQVRQSNEETRKSNETARVTAEGSRATAEGARANAETARVQNETERKTAEASRASAETARANAEAQRQTNEQLRQMAENSRGFAETQRVNAEDTRKANETARVQAETSRDNAEAQRVSAENARNVWEDYDVTKAYTVGNKVAYGGSSYLCIKPCTGIAPPNAEYWRLIAKKGEDMEVTAEKIADAMSLSELAAGDMVRVLSVDSKGKPMTWGRKALDFINALDYGVKGDGITNDAPAIQALLDQVGIETTDRNVNGNGTLHLPAATYLISSPLVIGSNVHIKCDGLIKYTGTGSAVIVDGRYSYVEIAMISAENGTGFEMDASRNNHATMSNDIRIGRIRPCVRGIYIHDDADHMPVTTNYIQCDYIDGGETAGTYGIEVYSDRKYLTEMHYTIGHVTAFSVGLYVHSAILTNDLNYAASQRFHQIHIEGVTESGIILENVRSCIFENLRLDEGFGDYAVTFKGSVGNCSIQLNDVDFSKINISELNYARANRLFAPMSLSNGHSIGYDYILTNNPVTGLPAILPLGRTTTVIYNYSTYQQVVDLYQRGMGVLLAVGNDATSALSLVKADLQAKAIYFSGLVPTASNTFYYGRSCICKEVDGVTTWEMRKDVALQTKKITATISEQSAEDEYPSAKAVWDHCKDFLTEGDLSGKQDKIEAAGILKGTAGGVVAAVAGTDYAAANHTHTAATENAAGFMSAADKSKLDGIAHGANNTTVDAAMSTTSTNPVQNKVVAAAIDSAIQSAIQNTWEASY